MDGDGFDDLLVGACGDDEYGTDAGAAYLVLGSATPESRNLAAADAKFTGEVAGDFAGLSVSTAGDVNGDGFDDVLVGAPYANAGGGVAYLLLGSTEPSTRSLHAADAQLWGDPDGEFAGISIAGAGDTDGDGFGDVLVGAVDNADGGYMAGAAYLMLGSASPASLFLDTAEAQFSGAAAGDNAGFGVAGAGDVDGDGLADLLVGAYDDDDGGANAGAAYLILGTGL